MFATVVSSVRVLCVIEKYDNVSTGPMLLINELHATSRRAHLCVCVDAETALKSKSLHGVDPPFMLTTLTAGTCCWHVLGDV